MGELLPVIRALMMTVYKDLEELGAFAKQYFSFALDVVSIAAGTIQKSNTLEQVWKSLKMRLGLLSLSTVVAAGSLVEAQCPDYTTFSQVRVFCVVGRFLVLKLRCSRHKVTSPRGH